MNAALLETVPFYKAKVQYRVVGTDEWLEQSVIETRDNFEFLLEGLVPGADYEYRYVLEDLSGNQLIDAPRIL